MAIFALAILLVIIQPLLNVAASLVAGIVTADLIFFCLDAYRRWAA